MKPDGVSGIAPTAACPCSRVRSSMQCHRFLTAQALPCQTSVRHGWGCRVSASTRDGPRGCMHVGSRKAATLRPARSHREESSTYPSPRPTSPLTRLLHLLFSILPSQHSIFSSLHLLSLPRFSAAIFFVRSTVSIAFSALHPHLNPSHPFPFSSGFLNPSAVDTASEPAKCQLEHQSSCLRSTPRYRVA